MGDKSINPAWATVVPPPGHRHGVRRVGHRSAAFGLSVVLAAGGVFATAMTANAEWIDIANLPAGLDSPTSSGYRVWGDFGSHPSSFLGSVQPPTNHPGEITWCTEGDKTAPGTAGVPSTSDTVHTDMGARRMAYIVDKYGQDPGNALDMAAVSYNIRLWANDHVAQYEAGTPQEIKDRAAAMMADANVNAGRYVAGAAINVYDGGGQRSGVINVTQPSVQDDAGNVLSYPAGVGAEAVLTGSAVFDDNGNGKADPGEDGRTEWATDGNAQKQLRWVTTPGGSGESPLSVSYDRAGLWANVLNMYGSDAYQTTVTQSGDDPEIEGQTTVSFKVLDNFQPKLRTQVAYKYVKAGDPIIDTIEGYTDAGETWVPFATDPYVDLNVDVDVYGALSYQPPVTDAVPAGTPLLGRDTATVTGPGADGVGRTTGAVIAPSSGYYPIVAKFVVANQPADRQMLFKGDFTDKFGLTAETAITPMTLTMTSDVPTDKEYLSKGEQPVDTFTIDVDGLWLAEVGKTTPTDLPVFYEISEPVTRHGVTVDEVVQRAEFTVNHEGTFTTGQDGVPAIDIEATNPSAVYSIRHGVVQDKLTAAQKEILADESEKLDSGWWAPNESFTRRMEMVVETKADAQPDVDGFQQYVDQADPNETPHYPFTDHVTVSLKDAGDLWLEYADGTPFAWTTSNKARGMYVDAQEQGPLSAADADKVIADVPLTFTEPGTQVAHATTTDVGFAFWDTSAPADPHFVEGYQSDAWIKDETISARRATDHGSMVREYNVDAGARAFDTMWNANRAPNAGLFQGTKSGWPADTAEATVTLYAYNQEPTTVEVPEDARVVWTKPYSELVTNGEFLVGWGSEDKIVLPNLVAYWKDGTWYVFVLDVPADARHAGYTSPFNDIREQMFDSDDSVLPDPTIGSKADQTAGIGQVTGDDVIVGGATEALTQREGAEYIVNRAYLVAKGSNPATAADAQHVFTSEKVNDVGTGRVYTTDLTPEAAADIAAIAQGGDELWWVATLYDAEDNVLAEGVWGDPNEITVLEAKPWFTTNAVVVTDPATGATVTPVPSPAGGLVATGSTIADTFTVGGTLETDVTVQATLFYEPTNTANPAGTTLSTVTSTVVAENIELVVPAGEYGGGQTFDIPGNYTIPKDADGVYGFQVTPLDENYNNAMKPGVLGEPSETVRAIETNTLAHTSDARPDESDKHSDEILIEGPVLPEDGVTATSTLYGVKPGADITQVCTAEEAIYTSGEIAVEGPGSVWTDTTTLPDELKTGQLDGVTWQETITIPGPDDETPPVVIDRGECGNSHETKWFTPQVKTVAIAVADPESSMTVETIPVVGDTVFDTFTTKGTFPEGSTVTVDAFYAEPGQPFDAEHVTKVWTSQPVPVTNDVREYRTTDGFDTSSLTKGGTLGFVERLRDKDGNPVRDRNVIIERDENGTVVDVIDDDGKKVVPDGVLGEPDETLALIDIRTQLGHEDTSGNGLMGDGDRFWDNVPITGLEAAGATATVKSHVYSVPEDKVEFGDITSQKPLTRQVISVAGDVCTPDREITTLPVAETITKDGTYRTESFILARELVEDKGAMTMVEEATITRPGVDETGKKVTLTRTIHGECGAISETGGPLAATKFQGAITPARTGVDPLVLAAAGGGLVLLAGAGAGYLAVRRRRAQAA